MYLNRDDNRTLLAFLTLSLLLHLLVLLLVPELPLSSRPEPEEPVYVEVRPLPRPRELDLPRQPDQPRETPARRLGPSDRVVEKETAPKGDFIEDRSAAAPAPAEPTAEVPATPQVPDRQSAETDAPAAPDLSRLLALPQATVARLDDQMQQLRTKYRPEVEQGDTIWLDTEQDLLFSFYQRLRSGIYRVWNYPAKSKEQGEAGICLVRMTFHRDGTVKNVELLESSGFPRLDREAVAAVYKGAPYGKLPDTYEKEDLSILAFFHYTISRSYISN